jgi:hypothetical protein
MMQAYLQGAQWIWAQNYDQVNMFLVAQCPIVVPYDAT